MNGQPDRVHCPPSWVRCAAHARLDRTLTLNFSRRSEGVVAASDGEAFTSTSQGFRLSSMSMSYPYSSKQCLQ